MGVGHERQVTVGLSAVTVGTQQSPDTDPSALTVGTQQPPDADPSAPTLGTQQLTNTNDQHSAAPTVRGQRQVTVVFQQLEQKGQCRVTVQC